MWNTRPLVPTASVLFAFVAGCGGELHPFSGPAPGCNADGFCDRSLSTGADLNAVFGFSADDVWVVGDGGLIAHWDGERFTVVPSPTRASLLDIWGALPDDVWAVGREGTLIHWDGQAWRIAALMDPSLSAQAIFGTSGGDVWTFPLTAWIDSHGLHCLRANLHFDGQRWQGTSDKACENTLALWGSRPDDTWAAGCEIDESGKCIRGLLDRWDGQVWHREMEYDSANVLVSLSGTAPDDVWAVGFAAEPAVRSQGGVLLRYDGQMWAGPSVLSLAPVLLAVWAVDSAEVWAAGIGGQIMRLREGMWAEVDSGVERDLRDLFAGDGRLWVVGDSGTILTRSLRR